MDVNKITIFKKPGLTNFFKAILLFVFFISYCGFSQTIQVNSVAPNPACGGQTVTVTFTATNGNGNNAQFSSATVFSVFLSTNVGGAPYSSIGTLTLNPYSFLPGVNNGKVYANIQGTINLPSNASGTYKIAVGATSPVFNASTGAGASPSFISNTAPIGGSVTGGVTLCPGINSTLLTLSGYTGTISKWQSSTVADFSANITDIVNTNATYTVSNVNVTTYYRAVVTNGTCPANSNATAVQVASGTPSSDQNICFNTAPAAISLTGYQGSVQQWQWSTDNISFYDINGATNATLTSAQIGNLVQTTYFRAVVNGGVPCGIMNSNVITVVVSTASFGGTVSPANTAAVCPSATTVLTLSGQVGSVLKWQSSTNSNFNQNFIVDILNTTNTLTITDLTTTTYYRVLVQNGGCTGAISTQAVINAVNNAPIGGALSPVSSSLCSGTNSTTLTLGGSNGTVVRWESSNISDFSTGVTSISNTTTTLTVTNLSTTTYYRAVLSRNGCLAYSSIATITVFPPLSASITANNGPICAGDNAVFNLSGTSGAIVTYSINGGVNQAVLLSGGVGTVTINGINANQTLTLVSVSAGSCSQLVNGTSTVLVNYTNTWTGVVDNQWNNSGNWSCGVLPNQSTDVVINAGSVLISSVDAFANTLTINGTSTVTVNSGTAISVTGAVNVASGATMTLQNNANLIQVTNVANTGAIVVNRQSSALMRQDYTLWSSPVMSQNLLAFSPQTLPNRFYVYNSATNVYNSVVPSTNSFQLGKGYLIRMPDNHPTTPTIWNGVFRGVPNNGTINLSLYNGGAGLGYNAIGNPYPSPIDLTSFVNGNNGNITGTLYFWRKTNSTTSEPGYCTWTTAGFVSNGESQVVNPNGVLRTGQGFIVEMSGNSNSLSFTNLMRINDTANQFFRNSNLSENRLLSGDKIWLNIVNETGADNQMLLGYFSSATLGMDYAIDGKAIEDASVSLTMDVSGVNCLIQGRPVFDISDIVPLRFKTPYSGLHTISIDHLEGVFSGNQEVYLKDNLLNVTHPIKASSYSFISDAGTFTNRFEIVYQNGLLSVNQADFNASLVVYKDKDGGLNITSNGFLVNQVEVYDISGRVLIKKSDVNSSSTTISGLNYTNQVLLVKVISADGKEAMKKIAF